MNPNIIYIGGAKGVGKSTLISSIESELPNCEVIDVTIWMREYTNLNYRDQLDEITIVDRYKAREYAFPQALKNKTLHNLIFDSHFCIPSIYGHEWGFPSSFAENVNTFILITSEPKKILERRQKDTSRHRGKIDLETIELDLVVEKRYAGFIAQKVNKPYHIIQNNVFETARNHLLKIIQECV